MSAPPSALASLIESIISLPPSQPAFSSLQRSSNLTLRAHSTSLVDPFAIRTRLAGLSERWAVSNESVLADKLSARVQRLRDIELDGEYRFVPECLQLLLSLSDGRPNVHFEEESAQSRLERLQVEEELKRGGYEAVEHDGDEGLWESIDYREAASDDDSLFVPAKTARKAARRAKNAEEEDWDEDAPDELFMDQEGDGEDDAPGSSSLADVERTRTVLDGIKKGSNQQISEATVLREAIHMVHGLPTSLFTISPSKQVQAVDTAQLMAVSSFAIQGILSSFARLGSKILPLLSWTRQDEQSPTMRRFQSEVHRPLVNVLTELQNAERRIIDSSEESPTAISLLNAMEASVLEIELLGSCLPAAKGHDREVRLLDNLARCITEQEAVAAGTDNLIPAFIQCFDTYWRPVEEWLQGANIACDGITFIQAANEKDVPLDGIWKGLFDYTYKGDGSFEAPRFLQPFIPQFMAIGKTAYMLNKLDQRELLHRVVAPSDWLGSVLLHERHPFEPFEDCITSAVHCRLRISDELSQSLLTHLHTKWRFRETILAIELVYLARLGSINDRAYTSLFNLMDRSRYHEWQDQYILTGIFQDAFWDTLHVDPAAVTASFVPTDRSTGSRNRSILQLEAIQLNLTFSWPLANIIDAGAMAILQHVAVLLMQVARAKDVLDQYAMRFNPYLITDSDTRRVVMSLHQRLRWFVNILHSYLAFDVLSSASLGLSASSLDAPDLDNVIREFETAMTSLQRGCFLSESLSSSHQAMLSILDLAIILADHCLRHRPSSTNEMLESDSDDDISAEPVHRKSASGPPSSSLDPDSAKLRELSATFHQLLTFVQAGVREASRTESDRRLELFADDLALELGALKWVR